MIDSKRIILLIITLLFLSGCEHPDSDRRTRAKYDAICHHPMTGEQVYDGSHNDYMTGKHGNTYFYRPNVTITNATCIVTRIN